MTQASTIKLDTGSRFPDIEFRLIDGSQLTLPGAWSGRWPRSKKSLKNSSNGEPGGNCGISGP